MKKCLSIIMLLVFMFIIGFNSVYADSSCVYWNADKSSEDPSWADDQVFFNYTVKTVDGNKFFVVNDVNPTDEELKDFIQINPQQIPIVSFFGADVTPERPDVLMDMALDSDYSHMKMIDINKILADKLENKCLKTVSVCFTKGFGLDFGENKKRTILLDMQYQSEVRNYQGLLSTGSFYYSPKSLDESQMTNEPYTLEDFKISIPAEIAGDFVTVLLYLLQLGKTPFLRFLDPSMFQFFETKFYPFVGNVECANLSLYATKGSDVELVNSFGSCKNLKTQFGTLEQLYGECENNDIESCDAYNLAKSNVQQYCSSLLQFGTFSNPCVTECTKVNERLASIEGGSTASNAACNLSDRLIGFIANIIKWIKYIGPVLVIILSIIDFIKAFSSSNDDDMKKAQGKFVKRLIAAALIFIIPFIIQFVLERFNLIKTVDDTYCNII